MSAPSDSTTIAGDLSTPYLGAILGVEHEVLLDDGDLVVERRDLVEHLPGQRPALAAAEGLGEEQEIDRLADRRQMLDERGAVGVGEQGHGAILLRGPGLGSRGPGRQKSYEPPCCRDANEHAKRDRRLPEPRVPGPEPRLEVEQVVERLLRARGGLGRAARGARRRGRRRGGAGFALEARARGEELRTRWRRPWARSAPEPVSLHSKRALGSKFTHWTQAWRAVLHFSHLLRVRIAGSTGAPHRAHLATWR